MDLASEVGVPRSSNKLLILREALQALRRAQQLHGQPSPLLPHHVAAAQVQQQHQLPQQQHAPAAQCTSVPRPPAALATQPGAVGPFMMFPGMMSYMPYATPMSCGIAPVSSMAAASPQWQSGPPYDVSTVMPGVGYYSQPPQWPLAVALSSAGGAPAAAQLPVDAAPIAGVAAVPVPGAVTVAGGAAPLPAPLALGRGPTGSSPTLLTPATSGGAAAGALHWGAANASAAQAGAVGTAPPLPATQGEAAAVVGVDSGVSVCATPHVPSAIGDSAVRHTGIRAAGRVDSRVVAASTRPAKVRRTADDGGEGDNRKQRESPPGVASREP
jgi:hypothetical protein